MTGLTRDGTAEPVSRDQNLRHERGQGNNHFLCSANHDEQDRPHHVCKSMDQPGKVANPARGQLNRES